jgi:hypothetical protein
MGIVTLFGISSYGDENPTSQRFYTTREPRDAQKARSDKVCLELDLATQQSIEVAALLTEDGRYFHLVQILPVKGT